MSEVYSCQVEVLDGSTVAIDISVSDQIRRLTSCHALVTCYHRNEQLEKCC